MGVFAGDWDIGGLAGWVTAVPLPAHPANKTAKAGKRSHRFMLPTISQIAYSQITKRLTTD